MLSINKQIQLTNAEQSLPGRDQPMTVSEAHYVNGHELVEPFPPGLSKALFGLGCFWGAEKQFWQQEGVYSTAVGYSGGYTPNPTYHEVCSGQTGQNEVVLVIYDSSLCSYEQLLKLFFESHNPTQGMRQGNDQGTQYRSGIYYFDTEQQQTAESVKQIYQDKLTQQGFDLITTEIVQAGPFYYAEDYHQQYLAKNPAGYCGLGGVGVNF